VIETVGAALEPMVTVTAVLVVTLPELSAAWAVSV
jgi:hypothetical protein